MPGERKDVVLAKGQTFGPYLIEEELGTGGMATTWRGRRRDHQPSTPIVLKTMLPHIARQPRFVAMFIREAFLGAELSHPNLVHVFDVGLLGDRYFIEMEFIAGHTIRRAVQQSARTERHLPIPVALATIADCCDALSYIHDFRDADGRLLGLVHRDVSPENLMISWTGVTKLLDFGIATAVDSTFTLTGERKGKMHYMPPEVFRSAPPDRSRDIYAVGATLYELVTGRRPFTGKNEAELMFQIAEGSLIRPSRFRPSIPLELETLILATLQRDPGQRNPDAAVLSRQLRAILQSMDSRPPQTIVAEAMHALFAVESPPEPKVTADESLATVDPAELVDLENPGPPSPRARSQATADLFTQSFTPRPVSVATDFSAVFTTSSPAPADDQTSSIFMLYGRSPARGRSRVDSVPPAHVRPPEPPAQQGGDAVDDENKKHALAHFERGLEHQRSGHLTAALAEWELAAELDPTNRTIATNVRILKRKMG